MFTATDENSGRKLTLYRASDTKIVRHKAIKSDANPYDPEWEEYFEGRLDFKMMNSIRGRRALINLWLAQDERCPECGERITSETGWHNHHIVQRCMGGSDLRHNRVLLHPECHRRIHAAKVEMVAGSR